MIYFGLYKKDYLSQRRKDADSYKLLTIRVIPFLIKGSLKLINSPSLIPVTFK